jgi:hypothetical protein
MRGKVGGRGISDPFVENNERELCREGRKSLLLEKADAVFSQLSSLSPSQAHCTVTLLEIGDGKKFERVGWIGGGLWCGEKQ